MDFIGFFGGTIEYFSSIMGLLAPFAPIVAIIAVWMQKRYRWVDSIYASVFKVGKKEKEIIAVWKDNAEILNSLAPEDAQLLSFRIGSMPNVERIQSERIEWLHNPKVLELVKYQETNKPHAIVVKDGFGTVSNHHIEYVPSDYATVEAAREIGIKPLVLSANAIIFCPATQEILIHLRGDTRTYPHAAHFIGGNYEPARAMEKYDDKDKLSPLRYAAFREIEEETGLVLSLPENPLVILSEEVSTGFIQCVYAGLSVTTKMRAKIEESLEGGLSWVSFEEFVDFVKTGKIDGQTRFIVPSAALSIMMWLKMGAPDQDLKCSCRKKAIETYDEIATDISNVFAKI